MIHCISFSRDGKMLASGEDSGIATIWDMNNKEIRKQKKICSIKLTILSFSSTGDTMAIASGDHLIYLWKLSTNEIVSTFEGPKHSINSL